MPILVRTDSPEFADIPWEQVEHVGSWRAVIERTSLSCGESPRCQ
jgi:hypothetical protein